MGKMKNVYIIFIGKLQDKRPLKHRWENNMKMNLKETGFDWLKIRSHDRIL
jgi:hypothetical protein